MSKKSDDAVEVKSTTQEAQTKNYDAINNSNKVKKEVDQELTLGASESQSKI